MSENKDGNARVRIQCKCGKWFYTTTDSEVIECPRCRQLTRAVAAQMAAPRHTLPWWERIR